LIELAGESGETIARPSRVLTQSEETLVSSIRNVFRTTLINRCLIVNAVFFDLVDCLIPSSITARSEEGRIAVLNNTRSSQACCFACQRVPDSACRSWWRNRRPRQLCYLTHKMGSNPFSCFAFSSLFLFPLTMLLNIKLIETNLSD